MAWLIEFETKAEKSLERLNKATQIKIINFLEKLSQQENPRSQGKALKGNHSGTWRYRIGDYRLICRINDKQVTILVLDVGHRKNIYD